MEIFFFWLKKDVENIVDRKDSILIHTENKLLKQYHNEFVLCASPNSHLSGRNSASVW